MIHLRKHTLKQTLLLFVLVVVIRFLSFGQSSNSSMSNQYWLDFNVSTKISDNIIYYGKIGAKTISPNSWNKIFVTGEIAWWIPKTKTKKLKYNEKLYAGLDIYYLDSKNTTDAIEISPYQGYMLIWPNRNRIDIKHNVELSERFQWGLKQPSYSFGLRVSYEATLVLKLQGDVLRQTKGFYLSASAKFWWNLIETNVFNDIVRITPGIGYRYNEKWRTAFYVGYNYTRNLNIDEFDINSMIYRLRIYYTIN